VTVEGKQRMVVVLFAVPFDVRQKWVMGQQQCQTGDGFAIDSQGRQDQAFPAMETILHMNYQERTFRIMVARFCIMRFFSSFNCCTRSIPALPEGVAEVAPGKLG